MSKFNQDAQDFYENEVRAASGESPEFRNQKARIDRANKKMVQSGGNVVHLSWTTVAANAWRWLLSTQEGMCTAVMPPLAVDIRHTFGQETDDHITMMTGEMLTTYWIGREDDDGNQWPMPTSYACHLYSRNAERLAKAIWGKHIPIWGMEIFMFHTVIHEFGHHLTNAEAISQAYEYEYDLERIHRAMESTRSDPEAIFRDECRNEAWTLRRMVELILTRYLHRDWAFVRELQPALGGPYIRRLCEKDDFAMTLFDALLITEYLNDHSLTPEVLAREHITFSRDAIDAAKWRQQDAARREGKRFQLVE